MQISSFRDIISSWRSLISNVVQRVLNIEYLPVAIICLFAKKVYTWARMTFSLLTFIYANVWSLFFLEEKKGISYIHLRDRFLFEENL